MITPEECLTVIRKKLGDYRYHHSLCVAEQAVHLAEIYGVDGKKAEIAGLLHDVMKDFPKDKMPAEMGKRGIVTDPVTRVTSQLWHAVLGADFVEHDLGVSDPEIIEAIRYHTTGRAGMSVFEELIYLADFTSADRDYPDADRMREIVDRNLDSAFREALRYTIARQAELRRPVHPDSVAAYNEVLTRNPPAELRLD